MLAKIVEPIVVSPCQSGGEARLHIVYHQGSQASSWIEHGDIDSFDIHGLKLDFRRPSARCVTSIDLLVAFKVMTWIWPGLSNCLSGPVSAIGVDHAEVTHVRAGHAARRPRSIFAVDVTLPKIRRLHNVHVTIQNPKTLLGHLASSWSSDSIANRWCQQTLNHNLANRRSWHSIFWRDIAEMFF